MDHAADNEDFVKMQRYGSFLNHLVGKYWNDPGKSDWVVNIQKMIDLLKEDHRRVRPDLMKKANKALQRLFDEERGMAIPLQGIKPARVNPKSEPRDRSDSPPFGRILKQIEDDDELQIWQSRGPHDQTPRSPSPEAGYGLDTRMRTQPRPIPTHNSDPRFLQHSVSPKPAIPVIPLEEAPPRHPPFQPPRAPPSAYSNYHYPPSPHAPTPPPPANYAAPYHNHPRNPYDGHHPPPPRMNPAERDRGPRPNPWDRPPPEYYMANPPGPANHEYPSYYPPNEPPPFHAPRNERDYRDFQEDRPNSATWTSFEQPPPTQPVRSHGGTHVWRGPPGTSGPPMGHYPPNEPYGRPRMDQPPVHSTSPHRAFEHRRGLLPHPPAGAHTHAPPPHNRAPLLPNPAAPHVPPVASPGDRSSFPRPNRVWNNAPPPTKPTPPGGGTKPTPPGGGTKPTPPGGGTKPTPPGGGTKPAPKPPEDHRVRRESGGSKDGSKRMSYEEYRQRRNQDGGSTAASGPNGSSAQPRPSSTHERPGFGKEKETHASVAKNDPRTKSALSTPNRSEPAKTPTAPREEATPISPLDSLYQAPSSGVPVTGKGYGVQRFKIPKKRPEPLPVPPPSSTPPPSTPPPASPASPAVSVLASPSLSKGPAQRRPSTSGSESAEPPQDKTPHVPAAVPAEAAKDPGPDAPLEIIEAYIKKVLPNKEAQDILDKLRKLDSAKEQSTIYREIQEFQEDVEDEDGQRRSLPRRAKTTGRARVLSSSDEEEETPDKGNSVAKTGSKQSKEAGSAARKKKAGKTMLDRLREDVVDFYKRFDVTELDTRRAKAKDSATAERHKEAEDRSSSRGRHDEDEEEAPPETRPAKAKAKKTPIKAGGGKKKLKGNKKKPTKSQNDITAGATPKKGRGRPKKPKSFAPTHLSLRGKRSMYVNEEEADDESGEPYHTCPLCEYVCVNIVQHYVSEHPGTEIPFAKFPEVIANIPGPPPQWPTYVKPPTLHWIPDKWVGGSSIKCQLCPPPAPAFDRRWQCLEHALSHALPPGTVLSCLWCHAEFGNLYALQDHVTAHTGEYRYTCGYCSHKAATLEGIEAHMGSLHKSQDRHFFEVEAALVDRDTFWLQGYVCSKCNYAQLHEETLQKHVEKECAAEGAEISRVAFLRVVQLVTKEEKDSGRPVEGLTVADGEEEEELDRELEAMAQAVPTFVEDESEEDGGELVSTVEVEDRELKPEVLGVMRSSKLSENRAVNVPPNVAASRKNFEAAPQSQTDIGEGLKPIGGLETRPRPLGSADRASDAAFLRIESVTTLSVAESSVEAAAAPPLATPTHTAPNQSSAPLVHPTDTPEASSTSKETEDDSNEDKETELEGEGLTGHALFRCGTVQCDYSSMSLAGLKEHLNDCPLLKSSKQLICRVCERPFRQVAHLLEHLPLHGAKRFSCGLCQYRTPLANHVKKHLKSFHKVGQWEMIPLSSPPDPDNGNFGIFPREVVTPTMRLKAGLPPVSPSKAGPAPNGIKVEPVPSTAATPANTMKLTYSMHDVDALPHKSIFITALRCAHCTYFSKVRTNLVRHLNLHQNATLPIMTDNVDAEDKEKDNNNVGAGTGPVVVKTEIPTQAPINPVPCLEKKERMFDKMTNLAYSSHATEPRNLRTHVSPTEMAQLPKFVEEHQRFVCGYKDCRYLTVNESMLKCHLVTLHKDEVFACVHCPDPEEDAERPLYSLEAFRAHLKLHGPRLYKCGYCLYHHYQRQIIERHLNDKHPHQPPRECVIRGPEDEITLETHLITPAVARTENSAAKNAKALATPEKARYAWRCSMCKFGHDIESALEQHINSVHGIGARFKCAFCAFVAPERAVVEGHAAQEHEGQDVQVLIMFYKMDVTDYEQLEGQTAVAPAPLPLWRRDETRVRHIRGILLEESNMKATAPVATILPASPDKRVRKAPDSGAVVKPETVEKDISIEPLKITVPTALGEPDDKFLVCPLCPSFRAMATRDLREHLYRKFNFKKYKCSQCDAANWSRKAMIRHMQTVHLLGSVFVGLDTSQPEFDQWVEQVLRHQTTVLNRPLRMRKWHKAPTEDSASSSPTKRPRLSPPTVKSEAPELADSNTFGSVSDLSSGTATPIKPEPADEEPAAALSEAPTLIGCSETDTPPVVDIDPPTANAPRGKKRPRQVSMRNLRNARVVNTPSGEQEFHCPACTYNCTTAKDMEKHVNKTCLVLFPAPSTSHDAVSANDKFVCAYCPVTGPNHETLRDHYDEVHYPAFLAADSLDSHPFQVRPHVVPEKINAKVPRPKPTGQYRCQHCKQTGEYEAMRQHSAEVHPQMARRLLKVQPKKLPAKKAPPAEIFVCDWCQTRLSSEEEVKKHHDERHPANVVRFSTLPAEETSTGTGTDATSGPDPSTEQQKLVYDCPLCAFKSLSQLGTMNHLISHCKPYQCSKCSVYFLTEGSGSIHVAKKHPTERTLCKIPSAVTTLEMLRQQVRGRPLQENETGFPVRKANKANVGKANETAAVAFENPTPEPRSRTTTPTKGASASVPTSPAHPPTVPVPVLIPIQPTTSGVSHGTSPPKLLPLPPKLSLLPTLQPANAASKMASASPRKAPKLRAVARKSTSYRFSQEARPKKPYSYHMKEASVDVTKVTAYMTMKDGIPIKVNVATMAKLINLDAQLILEDCSKQPQRESDVTKDEAASDEEEEEEEEEEDAYDLDD